MVASRLGKLSRRWAGSSGPYEAIYRLLFEVLFWVFFAQTYLAYLLGEDERFGVAPVTLAFVALAAAWLLLPWEPEAEPGASRRRSRLLAVPAFLAAVFAVGYLSGTQPFYAVAVAHAVFLFGFRRSVLYAAAILPLLFAQLLLLDPGRDVVRALGETAAWVSSFAFVIGLCAALVEAGRRQREAQGLLSELRSAHAELEAAHAELKSYAARIRELAVDQERARMAREMHDSVGHYLTVVNVQLEAVGKLMDRRPDEAREGVARAKELASRALAEVRRSVRALKPLGMDGRDGAAGALRALAQGFEGTGLYVSFEAAGEEHVLPEETELVLYRALQEGLTNALKHSGAGRVRALLAFGPAGVRLSLTDDGEGTPGGGPAAGFGLGALKERVEALGGAFVAGNAPEGGFALEVELPAGPGAEAPPR